MLPLSQIADLLIPYLPQDRDWSDLYQRLAIYLELLLKWNARTNLTAVRDPIQIVQRHFGESLFAALHLPATASRPTDGSAEGAARAAQTAPIGLTTSLLDFGSGAGFPGIPIQLLHPKLHVTLAESQGKKSAFLREVNRALDLPTEIWPRRVEEMPATRLFDCVTLRAVDNMQSALQQASVRSTAHLLILTTRATDPSAPNPAPTRRPTETQAADPTAPQRTRFATDLPARRGTSLVRDLPTPTEQVASLPVLPGFTTRSIAIPETKSRILLIASRQIVPRGTI